jgi:hypothetical protein
MGFLDALKAKAEYAAVPVIIHSSAPSRAPKGATRVLQKPLKLERLLAAVAAYCKKP